HGGRRDGTPRVPGTHTEGAGTAGNVRRPWPAIAGHRSGQGRRARDPGDGWLGTIPAAKRQNGNRPTLPRSAWFPPECRPNDSRGNARVYRLENWEALRAFFKPYLWRSFMRGSRRSRPACFSGRRYSSLTSRSARAMPCRVASAWPVKPPPTTFTFVSNLPNVSVIANGSARTFTSTSRPK